MPQYCCAGECNNRADKRRDLSFHKLPFNNKQLLNVWITKMKRDPRFFKVSKFTTICSEHFKKTDFLIPGAKTKRLKPDAIPTIFKWTISDNRRRESTAAKKLEEGRTLMEIEREVALRMCENEEEDVVESATNQTSRKTQTYGGGCSSTNINMPCCHCFSVAHLVSKCTTPKKEKRLFAHFTGFESYLRFQQTLEFLVPKQSRSNFVNWNTAAAKSRSIDGEKLFENVQEETNEIDTGAVIRNCDFRNNHKLSVADEFLMVLMKLRMGLSHLDLAERFDLSESKVSSIIITWINYLYIILGSLKIWPSRDIIIKNAQEEFREKYPTTVIILDATELKIQTPSSLLKQSETYSNYKSCNTLKCLIGVDSRGGIMFVSHLYEGSISDKEIVNRCGILDVLKLKLECGELHSGDGIMADKGFNIGGDLEKIGLKLNIPPFLRERGNFNESDVIETQTIARHRIHVERAIGKVRRFKIFNSPIPVTMAGTVNQIWTVACLLSNFYNPIL